jgi:NADH:ubiquinone oxidoreductase subunit 2 (subunit N)
VFLKIGLFPFFLWFLNSVYGLPNFIFFLVNTLQKLPILLMFFFFFNLLSLDIVWFSIFFTIIFAGFMSLNCLDFRALLLVSSVINNSWILMSQMVSFAVFCLFFFFYSLNFYLLFHYFGSFIKLNIFYFSSFQSTPYFFFLLLVSFSGLPPFPIFFLKLLTVYYLFLNSTISFLILFILLSNVMLVVSYFQIAIYFMINKFISSVSFFMS